MGSPAVIHRFSRRRIYEALVRTARQRALSPAIAPRVDTVVPLRLHGYRVLPAVVHGNFRVRAAAKFMDAAGRWFHILRLLAALQFARLAHAVRGGQSVPEQRLRVGAAAAAVRDARAWLHPCPAVASGQGADRWGACRRR